MCYNGKKMLISIDLGSWQTSLRHRLQDSNQRYQRQFGPQRTAYRHIQKDVTKSEFDCDVLPSVGWHLTRAVVSL